MSSMNARKDAKGKTRARKLKLNKETLKDLASTDRAGREIKGGAKRSYYNNNNQWVNVC